VTTCVYGKNKKTWAFPLYEKIMDSVKLLNELMDPSIKNHNGKFIGAFLEINMNLF